MGNFSPTLLNNFSELKRFASGAEEIRQITGEKPKALYFSRWKVLWIRAKAPFEYLLSTVLKILAHLFYALNIPSGYRVFSVLSFQMLRDQIQLEFQKIYGKRLLVPAFNEHQIWSSDYYRHGSRPVDYIKDPSVKWMTFLESHKRAHYPLDHPYVQNIHFHHEQGNCRGSVLWFLNLYLKTKSFYSDPKEHAMAVAKIFEAGAPRQAALMQTLNEVEGPLLGLKYENQTTDFASVLGKIQSLPKGVYYLGINRHALALIWDEKGSFFWDPSAGLVTLEGDRSNQLFERISMGHDPTRQYEISFEALK